MNRPKVTIIGTGALGRVLARALSSSDWPVKSLYNRSPQSLNELAEELEVEQVGAFPAAKDELGRLIFLTVPDRAIEKTAEKLATIDMDFSGYTVVHCSGSQSSSILKSVQNKGAEVASFHPIQTFVSSSSPSDLQGIYFDIEGKSASIEVLQNIANYLGSNVIEISTKEKRYLHAASVMASNYVIALMESAGQIAAEGGLNKEKAQKALLPLMQKSVANISKNEHLADALSGPVARGDSSTIAEHVNLPEQNKRLSALYKSLGAVLVQMMEEEGEISAEKIKEMNELLSDQ